MIRPTLRSQQQKKPLGRFIIGTVQGDIHDLGKDIVAVMLECNGFEVYDLGVDVPPKMFVEKTKEVNANIVGLSALLTVCIDTMREIVKAFEESGLRSKVKIVIGGGIVNEIVKEKVGADAYATDALAAVRIAREILFH